MMKRRIEDIGVTVHDLQTQLAYQNDVMLRALASMKASGEASEDSGRYFSVPESKVDEPLGDDKVDLDSRTEKGGGDEKIEAKKTEAVEDDAIPSPFDTDDWDDIVKDDEDGEPDFDDGDEASGTDEAPLPEDYF